MRKMGLSSASASAVITISMITMMSLMSCVRVSSSDTGAIVEKPIQDPWSTHLQDARQLEDQTSLQCIESICGKESAFPHPLTSSTANSQTLVAAEAIKKDFERPLKIYMGHTIHKNLLIDQAVKINSKNNTEIKLSNQQKSFYQVYTFITKGLSHPSLLRPNSEGFYFDEAVLKQVLNEEQKPYVALFKNLEKTVSQMYSYERMYALMPYLNLLQYLFPQEKDLKDALIKDVELMKVAANFMKTVSPVLALQFEENTIMEKVMAKKDLSVAEYKFLGELSKYARNLFLFLRVEKMESYSEIPFDESKEFKKLLLAYDLSETGAVFRNPTTLKNSFQKAADSCLVKTQLSYMALPTQTQIDKFGEMLNVVLATAQTMAEEKSQKSLGENLKVKINYPLAKENAPKAWQQDLIPLGSQTDRAIRELKTTAILKDANSSSVFMALAISSPVGLFAEALAFCDKTQPPFLNDSANNKSMEIQLSWPTITHPEKGLGIIAHEVAHIVSKKFPEVSAPARKCLSEKQGKDLYEEEDFADLFSAALLKRLSHKVLDTPTTNMVCGLISRDKDGWIGGSFHNLNPADNHSSSVYRLFATATLTDSLTPACQAYAESVRETRFKNYCQW